MNTATPFPTFGVQGLSDFLALVRLRQGQGGDWVIRRPSSPPVSDRLFNGDEIQSAMSEGVKLLALSAALDLAPRLHQRINELAELQEGWDGEHAEAVKPHALADAVESLKRLSSSATKFKEPFIAPTFNGGIQLEWQSDNRSLDLELVENGWSAVGTEITDGQSHYSTAEFERNDFRRMANFYLWVCGEEMIWPSS